MATTPSGRLRRPKRQSCRFVEPTVRRTVHLISNQAHSTTLAPLLDSTLYPCRRPADVSTPDLTRHLWWLALRAHSVRPKRLRRLVESGPLTAGVLPAALRAASRFKIAPGDFVDHSGTSPLGSRLEAAPTNHITAGSRSYEPHYGWKPLPQMPLVQGLRIVRNGHRVG